MSITIPLPLLDKVCGDCSECCIVPSLAEMNKEMHEPCRYLNGSGHGCSIYADRPPTCSGFLCLWKVGQVEGDERQRPDKLGLMFVGSALETRMGGQFVVAWETRPGAYDEPAAHQAVAKLAALTLVLVRRHKSKESIPVGPIPLVRHFLEVYGDVVSDDQSNPERKRLRSG